MANISNSTSNTIINGTSGADSIVNSGKNVQIYAGAGNDYIAATTVLQNVTISCGDGDDSVRDYGYSGFSVDGGNGNDLIFFAGAVGGTITGGDGNDMLGGNNIFVNSISGGAGDDTVLVIGYENTIEGGAGNDQIGNYPDEIESDLGDYHGNVYIYRAGDGADIILGFKEEDTLIIVDSSYTTEESGDHVFVWVGSGYSNYVGLADVVPEGIAPNIISSMSGGNTGTADADYITNTRDGVTIDALAGNDTIDNSGEEVLINGGYGDDSIYSSNDSYSGANVTIQGGAGNDTIVGRFGDSFIMGGAGNDKISMSGDVDSAIINGGTGDDTIYNDGVDGYNLFQYVAGDGDDVIYGFTSNDILQILEGTYSTLKFGADVIVKVGSGSITLKDAANIEINIDGVPDANLETVKGTAGSDNLTNSDNYVIMDALGGNDNITNTGDHVTISGGAGNDSVSNSGDNVSIDGGNGNDSIYSSGYYITIQGGSGEDSISAAAIIYSSIDGGDSGDVIYANYANFVTISGGDDEDTILGDIVLRSSVDGGEDGDLLILAGFGNTIIGGTGDDVVFNSLEGYNSQRDEWDLPAYSGNVYVYRNGDGDDTIWGFDGKDTLYIESGSITNTYRSSDYIVLEVGEGKIIVQSGTITGGIADSIRVMDASGKLSTIYPDDAPDTETIITGTSGADNITNLKNAVTIDALGGNDTIFSYGNNVSINGGAGNDSIKNNGNMYVTILGGVGNDTIDGGGGGLAYLDGGSGSDILSVRISARDTLLGGDGEDTIALIFAGKCLVDGGSGMDTLLVEGIGNTIIGGTGDDLIGNMVEEYEEMRASGTLVGDWGEYSGNIYQYSNGDGDDSIVGYNERDTLYIASGSINGVSISGEHGIVMVGSGRIVFENAADQIITVLDPYGITSTLSFNPSDGTAGNDNLTNNKSAITISAQAGNDTVSNSGDYVSISGGAGNDQITNSGSGVTVSGDAGNDTLANTGSNVYLDGGADNDILSVKGATSNVTITGGAGADTIYVNDSGNLIRYGAGDGKDVIVGFGESDSIQLTSGSISSSVISSSNVIFYIGTGTSNALTPSKSSTIQSSSIQIQVRRLSWEPAAPTISLTKRKPPRLTRSPVTTPLPIPRSKFQFPQATATTESPIPATKLQSTRAQATTLSPPAARIF